MDKAQNGEAADAARITDETAGMEDRKHTSGGVFIAVDSNLGAVVGAEEGAVASIPGNEGRITQAWVPKKRSPAGGSVARFARHPWLVNTCGSSGKSLHVQVTKPKK